MHYHHYLGIWVSNSHVNRPISKVPCLPQGSKNRFLTNDIIIIIIITVKFLLSLLGAYFLRKPKMGGG